MHDRSEATRRRAGRLALIAVGALLAACAAPEGQAPRGTGAVPGSASRPTIERVVVSADSVNLRAGPGTSNPVVGGARRGAPLEVIGRRGGWLEVRRGAGSVWIAARLTGPPGGRGASGGETEAPELPPIVEEAAPPPPPIAGDDAPLTTATADRAGAPPPPPITDATPAREPDPLPPIGGDDPSGSEAEDTALPGL